MREKNFIEQNKEKWKELEDLLKEKEKDPDKLTKLFIQVTDDLSYAKTYYPNRFIRLYLNGIAQRIFYILYSSRLSGGKKFINFWKEDLPRLIYSSRKVLLFSLCIFLLSFCIGTLSSAYDPEFASFILGQDYVQMTMENIRKGDPMAVYKKTNEADMFLGITFNNLRVSFLVFVTGIFYCIGSIGMLMYNGIMVGVFQYFFYKQNLLLTSSLSIWLHGTLEISSMILASAAGITMGRGLIFPGTHTRFQSFFLSARRGIKILLGIIPIVIIAAIIESFLTRYTGAPVFLKGGLIFLSLAFIVAYFVWYPYKKSKEAVTTEPDESGLPPMKESIFNFDEINTNGTIFTESFSLYRKILPKFLKWGIFIGLVTSITCYFIFSRNTFYFDNINIFLLRKIFNYSSYTGFYFINTIIFSFIIFITMKFISDLAQPGFKAGFSQFIKTVFFSAFINSFFYLSGWLSISLILVVGPFFMQWLSSSFYENKNVPDSIVRAFILLDTALGKAWGFYLVTLLFCILYFFIINTPMFIFYGWIFSWNFSFEGSTLSALNIILDYFLIYFLIILISPIIFIGNFLEYFTLREIYEANGLRKKIDSLKKIKS